MRTNVVGGDGKFCLCYGQQDTSPLQGCQRHQNGSKAFGEAKELLYKTELVILGLTMQREETMANAINSSLVNPLFL